MALRINDVSMDYFLRGVNAAKPKLSQPAGEPAQGNASQNVDEIGAKAGKLVAQLDILLMKAAKASTKGVNVDKLKASLQQLVANNVLDKATKDLIVKYAKTAADQLKALNKFTGRDLASAFDSEGNFDGVSTRAGKAIAAAIKSQQALSDLLGQVGKRLDVIMRKTPEMRQANAALRDDLDDMQNLCDRRATEINRLAFQMKDFALHLAAHNQNADPNIVAILAAKVDDLMPRQALAMHGTADALASVNEEVTAKLRPLARKIDAFRNQQRGVLTLDLYAKLQSDIATMKAAVAAIRNGGIEVRAGRGGRMIVSKDIISALEKELAAVEKMFKTARKDVVRKIFSNYIDTAKTQLCADDGYERHYKNDSDKYKTALVKRDALLATMDSIMEAVVAIDHNDPPEKRGKFVTRLNNLLKVLDTNTDELYEAARVAPRLGSASSRKFDRLLENCHNIDPIVKGFFKLVQETTLNTALFTGAEAIAVFEGKISVSALVEARARGLNAADVDPANDEANIVSAQRLGAGAAGTVYQLERKDGSIVIFKGETESRTGLARLGGGSCGNYDHYQQIVNIDIAANKAADALKMGGMIVRYSAGSYKGVFGFFMDKARGVPGRWHSKGAKSERPDAGLSADEIKRLPPDVQRRIRADLKRELNKLQWLDLVLGTTDRHSSNYFVHIDPETYKVTVKAIDNDACFSQIRTGAVKFEFNARRTRTVINLLKLVAEAIDKRNIDNELERMLQDPGISRDDNGNITIDGAKIKNKAVGYALVRAQGLESIAIPDRIDEETYNALVALKEGDARNTYLDSIRPRLSKESYDAAVSRLDDVIAHAERLNSKNRVVKGDGWLNVVDAPRGTGGITFKRQKGGNAQVGETITAYIHKGVCPSYFGRDDLGKLFSVEE